MLALHLIGSNESRNLKELLPEVLPHVDEAVIGIDESSLDDSLQVSLELNSKGPVVVFPHDEFAGPARNRIQSLIRSEWTLMLDADERPKEGFWDAVESFLNRAKTYDAALIERENRIEGHTIGGMTIERHARLYRSELRYISRLHEFIDTRRKRITDIPAGISHFKTALQQRRSDARNTMMRGVWHPDRPVRLHLGSGNVRKEGFINVDAVDYENVDVLWNFEPRMKWNEHFYPYPGCLPWEDGTVDEIAAYLVIEHISYHHTMDVLKDWARVLKRGGRLEMACPDLDGIIQGHLEHTMNRLQVVQILYAGQDFPTNVHYNCLDYGDTYQMLKSLGFERIKRLPARERPLAFTELYLEAYKG